MTCKFLRYAPRFQKEELVPSRSKSNMADKVKLYCSWFCPFAQRAWIALLHKNVDFEYVEQDPYNKTPEWLAVNPRGLVPALVHKGKSIYESSVLLEYVDEVWNEGKHILPKDPYERAYARIWADHVTKKIVPPFYAMLVKTSQEERAQAKAAFTSGIEALTRAMKDDGPFFLGKEYGLVDIMVVPWIVRFFILKKYRGFELPEDSRFDRFWRWHKAVMNEESVVKTIQPEDKMIDIYLRYADDSATSEVAEAIRSGKALP